MDIETLIAARPTEPRRLGRWYSELIDAAEREGVKVAELAERLGVVKETIYAWRRKRGSLELSESLRQAAAGLVRVRVVDDATEPRHDRPLELRLARGHCVLVPRGFDADSLIALLSALERC